MKTVFARDYGVRAGSDVSETLAQVFENIQMLEKPVTLVFDSGTYYINSALCKKQRLIITNTVGDEEFNKDETTHVNEVPFYIKNVSDLTVDGNNAVFVIDGKVTNVAIEDCKNVTLKNIEIRHAHPNLHELKVINKSLFSAEFEIDRDSQYVFENKKLYFYGNGYRYSATENRKTAFWPALIKSETPNKIERVTHPFFNAISFKEKEKNIIKVTFPCTKRFKIGDIYYIYNARRQYAGIFVNRSQNVVLDNVKQRFNYSLAFVTQDSENVSVINSEFAPEKGSARKMASLADFMQVCSCRGTFTAKNNYFDGAGDDCLNVHGIHFKVVNQNKDAMTVRFMHSQTHGFNPLRVGDTIASIDTKTLLEKDRAEITSSELLNETDIRLVTSNGFNCSTGDVIEDISACPNVDFTDNVSTRIITRGLLLTTRGKVNISNNRFISCSMSGILLSDDAKNWYESGMCKDVTIKNNVFDYCGQTPILIKPENSVFGGSVHTGITISDNTFLRYDGDCMRIASSGNIRIFGNKYSGKKSIITKNCKDVILED